MWQGMIWAMGAGDKTTAYSRRLKPTLKRTNKKAARKIIPAA